MTAYPTSRINSIDVLRGIVMIIMALDHTRDFFHITALTDDPLNLETTTIPLYFTRWVTHFCAPVFVFLSGTSAFLSSRNKSKETPSTFLIKRGLWLVLIEVTVITFGITFNPFYNFIIFQVIWAIGWSMVLLGLFVRFSYRAVLITGLLLFFGHNLTNHLPLPTEGPMANLLKILLTASGTVLRVDDQHFLGVFYAVLPWTGAMFVGYAFGYIYALDLPQAKRRQIMLLLGGGMVLLFIVLRLVNHYGDPAPRKVYPDTTKTILSFLNTTKYPPSLMYLCMTIGPGILALGLLENIRAGWTNVVTVYGRVPLFYYVLHFYLIHLLCMVFFFAMGHNLSQAVDPNSPFLFRPVNFGYGLPVVYLVWFCVVMVLYRPCKRYSEYKLSHRKWWLSYI